MVAFLGPAFAGLLSGSFVVETIFQIPGLGRFYVQAAFNRDYTMILGTTVFLSVLIVVFNLLSDILAAWMNPRLRAQLTALSVRIQDERAGDRSASPRPNRAPRCGRTRGGACAATGSPCAGWSCWCFSLLIALLTPWIAPYGYAQQNLELGATPPSAAHWLGTDVFGRDLLTQVMYGGRVSLAVGFIATAVALLIGVTWGAIAGYAGGRMDAVMMRLVDILYALPFMIFIVLLMVVFGRNMLLLFLAIGAVEWLTMARIMRAQVQSLRQQEFVEAADLAGPVARRALSSATSCPMRWGRSSCTPR